MPTLLTNETVIADFNEKKVTLTTQRLILEDKQTFNSYYQSILLKNITSCESYRSYSIPILIFAIALFGVAIVSYLQNNYNNVITIMAAILGVVALILFFVFIENLLVFGSASTKMKIKVDSMKKEKILEFIAKVEGQMQQ